MVKSILLCYLYIIFQVYWPRPVYASISSNDQRFSHVEWGIKKYFETKWQRFRFASDQGQLNHLVGISLEDRSLSNYKIK